jgi:hypothetical protein
VSRDPRTLTLSLISHTNVGKTTLVRTLLRRDVGEVLDEPHVTDVSEMFTLADEAAGRVVLWDTPGFGDSVRLLRLLRRQDNPLGWILTQVWDRFADRPLWCSQQAVRNARDEADVILYLVNAAEDPEMTGYVDAEMQVLAWIGRPVIVVLNQTGAPRSAGERRADETRWGSHLAAYGVVRDVMDLDAFTRCWIQEGLLLERIRAVLPPDRQPLMDVLLQRWRADSLATFDASMRSLARMLVAMAADHETLPRGAGAGRARRRALGTLARHVESALRASTAEVVALQGLEGKAAVQVQARLEDVSGPDEAPEPWKAGIVGGVAGGALGGLAADLAAGGLTFGAGTVLGALLGAMGLGGLAWGYQMLESGGESRVTWSTDFLARQSRDALLRYLAAAHFGRGAGAYREVEQPAFWREAAEVAVKRRRAALDGIWQRAREEGGRPVLDRLEVQLLEQLRAAVVDVLVEMYPGTERVLGAR